MTHKILAHAPDVADLYAVYLMPLMALLLLLLLPTLMLWCAVIADSLDCRRCCHHYKIIRAAQRVRSYKVTFKTLPVSSRNPVTG